MEEDYMKDQNCNMIGKRFLPLKRIYSTVRRGVNRKGETKLTPDYFLTQLDYLLKNDIKESLNFIRQSLSSMKKCNLIKLGDMITDLLSLKQLDFLYGQWYSVALDLIDC